MVRACVFLSILSLWALGIATSITVTFIVMRHGSANAYDTGGELGIQPLHPGGTFCFHLLRTFGEQRRDAEWSWDVRIR
jgi:hypothetical protein